jgi:hypothetical protein
MKPPTVARSKKELLGIEMENGIAELAIAGG